MTELERFMNKVDTTAGPFACWEWTAARYPTGYGEVRFRGHVTQAHRAAYTLLVGDIPPKYTIDHLCRNEACVNPSHLEAVTNAENVRRGKALITHCPRGHEYTPENTFLDRGSRACRTCSRTRARLNYLKKRQALNPAPPRLAGDMGVAA